jgi:membrane fusion protein, multidrug efflux system
MSAQVLDRAAARETVPDGLPGILASRRRSRVGRRLALALLGLIAVGGAAWYGWDWWRVGRFVETTDDAYVGGNVTTLSPHVAGFVAKILVGDNQFVRAGQLLIDLDDRDYQARLAHAEAVVWHQSAALANLHAKYALQQSTIREAEADLVAKQAEAGFAHQDAVRYHTLAVSSFGSLQNYQKAFAADQKAAATVRAGAAAIDAARQQLAVLDTEITATEASLAQAEADRRSAQLDLAYTRIRSPIDGYIGDRAAQIGAYATVGDALLSIVPAHGLWVDANFKEDELARMRPGEPATIVADVLPGRSFSGRVLSLAPATGAVFSVIPPQNATGNFTKIVQRVPVRIAVADGEATLGLLRPGLSTTVSVDTRADTRLATGHGR